MEIEKQVCSEEFAEILKELGVKQDSLFYHTWGVMPKTSIDFSGDPTSAFTCAELVQMNESFEDIQYSDDEKKFYVPASFVGHELYFNSFADSLAFLLIDSIQSGFVSVDEVNARLVS